MVTHNGRDLALTTLASARAATGDLDAEWLLVDSGSTDGTPDAVGSSHPDVRIWRHANIGFAAGNNVALEHARGRYVLLLNPDVEIARGTFEELVAAMDARPGVGLASVIQRRPDGRLHETIRRFPSPATKLGEALGAQRMPFAWRLCELENRPVQYAHERSADWVVGAFMIARREAVADVGNMDEQFFLYSEETDWCRRFHDAGWDVRHLPVMEVIHHGARRSRPELHAQLSHAKVLYAAKHLSAPKRELVRVALILRHAIRLLLIAPVSAVRPGLRQRLRGEVMALAVCCSLRSPPFHPSAGQTP